MKRIIDSILTSSLLLSASAFAQDKEVWPSWGGNLENTHQAINSPDLTPENISRLGVKWTYEAHGDISAIPVVSGKTVYFPDWGAPLEAVVNGGGFLHALDRETGDPIWSRSTLDFSKNLLNNFSRASFAISGDFLIMGDNRGVGDSILALPGGHGATLYGINRHTGNLVWKTTLDENDLSIVTQSPVIYNGRIYVGTSSNEEAAARITNHCCSFRGSMLALDLETGKILWKTYMTPKSREADGFTGNAIWGSQPAVDVKRNAIYIATGNNYTFPKVLENCLKSHKGKPAEQQSECYDKLDAPDNYASSVLALDLDTGAVKWARKLENYGAWTYACDPRLVPLLPVKKQNCEDLESLDFDFGQAPMLIHTKINGADRDVVAIGQKNGVFWTFDPDQKGKTIWATPVGPGGVLGGMEFGSATDGERIYVEITNFDHVPFRLTAGPQAGKVVNGGIWAALDVASGKILWQTADPSSEKPLKGLLFHVTFGSFLGDGFFATAKGPMAVANGVVFAGSMDRQGHMYAFDARDGRILWSFASGGSVMSAPAIVDNVLYWGSGYSKTGFPGKTFYAFELK